MKFQRGVEIRESLGIGAIEQAKRDIEAMGGLVLTPDDMYDSIDSNYPAINGVTTRRVLKGGQRKMYETTLAIVFEDDGTYTVLKNRWGEEKRGEAKDLLPLVEEWKKRYEKFQKTGNYEIPERKGS